MLPAPESASLFSRATREEGGPAVAGESGENREPSPPDARKGLRAWRKRLFWKLQAIGWGGTALMGIVFTSVGYLPLQDAVLLTPFRAVLGIVITCAMRYGFARLRKTSGNLWGKAALVLFGCGVISFADSGLILLLADALGVEFDRSLEYFLKGTVLMRWMFYWLWSVLYFGINYWLDTEHARLRLAQAEAAARSAELQLLRAQVNPHFLFNALNSILAESENPSSVQALTQALSDYLRFSLQQPGDVHALGVELDALENYLRVEKARFEENLEYRIDANAAARRTPIPIALVQTLLDNAIKYGQRSTIRPLRVVISAVEADGFLRVSVANTGEWIAAPTSTGTGLANLCRRLQLLYGGAASLATEAAGHEVRVHVRLPLAEKRGGAR